MEPHPKRFRLVNPERLRMLMERTGSGCSISGRALAAAVSVPHGTINELLTGGVKTQPAEVAFAISDTIGVDHPVLWAPVGRAVPAEDDLPPHIAAAP
ncbi:helix-turn-helix domain-containing protein [Streptomyces sp. JV180]|uniref:helix-turn-helix domain-containing protein n=1 Tax=Streptomyces sp. JV180 TaxID=858634 RepID=UPI00168C0A9E|nr:helix-turn-helix transcriptional regulator [Streptomyces sp. JV180]MBD3546796.1 helix-turn-helix transcriptional regulator [Streptomyces sp. JV180]